jgi:hypothetical protein
MRMLKVTVLLAALLVAGCSPSTKKTWSEEVDLGDGKTARISRTVKFETSNSWSGDAYGQRELNSTLSFEDRVTVPTLSTTFMPIVLYEDSQNHQWVVVATTVNCDIWHEQGAPIPPYWEYRTANGKWKEGPLSSSSIGRQTNLFFRYDLELAAFDLDAPFSINFKNDIRDKSRVTDKYKRVIGDSSSGC